MFNVGVFELRNAACSNDAYSHIVHTPMIHPQMPQKGHGLMLMHDVTSQ